MNYIENILKNTNKKESITRGLSEAFSAKSILLADIMNPQLKDIKKKPGIENSFHNNNPVSKLANFFPLLCLLLLSMILFNPAASARDIPVKANGVMELGGTLLSLDYSSDTPDVVHNNLLIDLSHNQTISVKAYFTGSTDSLTATFYNHSDDKQVKWQHIKTKDNQSAAISIPTKAGVYRMALAWSYQPVDGEMLYYKRFHVIDVTVLDSLPKLTIPVQPSRWTNIAEDTKAMSRLATIASEHPSWAIDYIETSINGGYKSRVALADSEYQTLNFKTADLWINGQCLMLKAEVFWLNGSSSAESFERCFQFQGPTVSYDNPLPNGWVGKHSNLIGKVVSVPPLDLNNSHIIAARVGHENEEGCSWDTKLNGDGSFNKYLFALSCVNAEGEWQASAKVRDQPGNTAADNESDRLRWSVDLTPPTITTIYPQIPGGNYPVYHNGSLTVWGTARDSGSGLSSLTSIIDNQETPVQFFPDGTFKAELKLPPHFIGIKFRATDAVGNFGDSTGQTVEYDGQAPNTSWNGNDFQEGRTVWLKSSTMDVTIKASDNTTGKNIPLAEMAWKKENGLWSDAVPMVYQSHGIWKGQLDLESNKFYQIRARSHDYAGNVSAWLTPGAAYYKSEAPKLRWPDDALEIQPGKVIVKGLVNDTLLSEVKTWIEYCDAQNSGASCSRIGPLTVDNKGFFSAAITNMEASKSYKIRLLASDVTGRWAPSIEDKLVTPFFSEFSLAQRLEDRDQSGGITPGDKVTLKLVINALADSNAVSLRLMLPPGLASETNSGPVIQLDPDSHYAQDNPNPLPAALNYAWTGLGVGKNDLLLTGDKAPDMKAGDRIILNIPLEIGENTLAKKLNMLSSINAQNNPFSDLSVTHVVETQKTFPAARAMSTAIYSPTVKPYERLPLGAPFVYRMHFDGGEWPALGAQLNYTLPAWLLKNGEPTVIENTTNVFISINSQWDGRQQTALFSPATLNNEVEPGQSIVVEVPVKLDIETGGELKSIVTATANNVIGKPQQVHCVYADVGDVYVSFDLCSYPVD